MSDAAFQADTQQIVVDEEFPHAPETIWKALTTGDLIGRWLMAPTGFEPVQGKHFTFQTKPAGAWDGTIRCQVLEVIPNERLVYAWQGGDGSSVGYGAPLNTAVPLDAYQSCNRHAPATGPLGFVTPKNDSALKTMGDGWRKVLPASNT